MKFTKIILLITIALSLMQCTTEQENPVPQVLSVSPSSKVAHLPEFTMTVNGQDFVNGSVIVFDGKEKATTFVSLSQLSCRISPEDTMMNIVSNNTDADEIMNMEKVVSVVVRNPAPGGGDSAQLNFTVKENFEFESPVRLFDSIPNGWIGPLIIDKNDKLHMCGSEVDPNRHLMASFVSTSEDKGDSWSAPDFVTDKIDSWVRNIIVDDQGRTHVFYDEYLEGNYHIFYKKKEENGQSWSEPVRLSRDDKSIRYNFIERNASSSGDKLFVFWNVYATNGRDFTMFAFSGDNGETWTEPVKLKELGDAIMSESIITSNETLVLTYGKLALNGNNQFFIDIYITRSTDNGLTWSEPLIISNGAGRSVYPRIAYSGTGEDIKIFWVYKQTGQITQSQLADIKKKGSSGFQKRLGRIVNNSDIPSKSNIVTSPSFHLRMVESGDNGNSWGPEKNILDFTANDEFFSMYYDIKSDRAGNLSMVFAENTHLI
ncbi:MAG: exo-alpha-sialidase, partial [Candidatus Aminicenantes bacterium]|nr:exo-alpha-sialidase [Candidatus Aminicenantes bacterium]